MRPPAPTDAASRTIPLPFRTESSPTAPIDRAELEQRLAEARATLPEPEPAVDPELHSLASLEDEQLAYLYGERDTDPCAPESVDDDEAPTSPATPDAKRATVPPRAGA